MSRKEGALQANDVPLVLCVAELDRPGRPKKLNETFFNELQLTLQKKFHPESVIIASGRLGGVRAVEYARKLLSSGLQHCLIVGVDSYLVRDTLEKYSSEHLLLTAQNSDEFIPGEAAAAILLGPKKNQPKVEILGLGFGQEPAYLNSGIPLRGQGLSNAIKSALGDARMDFSKIDYRMSDANGLQYSFKEAYLAIAKIARPVKQDFEVWHLADSIGEVGAAAVPAAMAYFATAIEKGFAPGSNVLCHFASDQSKRAALILGT